MIAPDVTDRNGGTISARALESDAEVATYFELAAATFPGYQRTHCTPSPGGSLAAGWRGFVLETPGFQPDYLRGAFLDGVLVGGCIHEERWLHVASARLRSGYVGGVVVDPRFRGRGIASVLMRDSIELGRQRGQGVIVLRGIPDFYGAFGYVDVFETTEHVVDPAHVLALPEPEYVVRPATLDDAPALLALYDRHHARRTGAYSRSLELQRHLVRHRDVPPVLAIAPDGTPDGYLLVSGAADGGAAVEAVADCWPAALALLRHHARARTTPPVELRWPLPRAGVTYYLLADHLQLRSETKSRPNAGWMARPGDLEALLDALTPLWRERWRKARLDYRGAVALRVEGVRRRLELDDGKLSCVPGGTGGVAEEREIALTAGALTQLVFGTRPAAWVAAQPGERVPADLVDVLAALCPSGEAFYPFSNRC
jgi:GNAT superfamily N-acetyltransferase